MSEVITKSILEVLAVLPILNKYGVKDFTKGEIPVYSSETKNGGIKGYCDIADFEISEDTPEYIVFGDHTRSVNVVKKSFSVMDNVKVLVSEDKDISLDYVRYMWENRIPALGYARHWKIAKEVSIPIPIKVNGTFDRRKQVEIADKYKIVEEHKKALLAKAGYLKDISVQLPEDKSVEWLHPLVTDIFSPQGGSAVYNKTWVSKNKGEIALYSGTTTGEYARVNIADYNGEYLTWCIDGLAGYIMYHNEAFSITGHRGVLLPTEKCVDIDLKYIKYVLEPIFRKRKKGREGDFGKNEYTSLKPIAIKRMKDTIPIPVKADGSFDLQKQKDLAHKYEQIEEIKKNISRKIIELSEVVVS